MAYLEADSLQAAEEFVVRSYECGCEGGMRPSAILRCFQEIAIQHCTLFGLPLRRMEELGVAFMLTRVHLMIEQPPNPGDMVKAVTWHQATKGVQFLRNTVLEDPEGHTLASCIGHWILVNRKTRSIMRPRDFPEYTVILQPNRALQPDKLSKITLPKNLAPVGKRRIRYTDIDHNGHLNNCVYADFFADFFPGSLHSKRFFTMDLHFIAEAVEGDTVELFAGEADGVFYMYGAHERGICFEAAATLSALACADPSQEG